MRIYPEKGFNPSPEAYKRLAADAMDFGLVAYVGREKTKNGYRKFVELMRPVEFGIEKAAPRAGTSESGAN